MKDTSGSIGDQCRKNIHDRRSWRRRQDQPDFSADGKLCFYWKKSDRDNDHTHGI